MNSTESKMSDMQGFEVSMNTESISLTDQIDVTNGSHILYGYSSDEGYLDNAAAFISTGVALGQQVVIIDSQENYAMVQARLAARGEGVNAEQIHFVEHYEYYCGHGKLQPFQDVLRRLDALVKPLRDRNLKIRSWGHVFWREQDDIFKRLIDFKYQCDLSLSGLGEIFCVCIYDGRKVSAHVQNEMLKSHEYFMTDTTLTKSMLYEMKDRNVVYPSLSGLNQMQSEMDLYKQKIDFVHVVSHEVRNPLTVIKAYARMLLSKQPDEDSKRKLKTIADYADVIDNEITHIINNEQMLLTESLWSQSVIEVMPVLTEAISIMATKARTQNIAFESRLALAGESIVGNSVGLRLIVSNLLSNAIKYSEEGGLVSMDVRTEPGELVMVIEDNGIGMSPEQMRKLFRKYEKMNEEKSGQGIGLFMVKKLVDHFEGTIHVQSELGRGTVMTVRLPLHNG